MAEPPVDLPPVASTPAGDVPATSRVSSLPAPPRGRYEVLALLCGLSMITYLDRVCFGTAAPLITQDLGLTSVAELKWAFTAFVIAYGLFEVPVGWMGDRFGPRVTLIRIVIWWSACTALTGLVALKVGAWTLGGLGTLVALRFLFGAGEAGAYPNITRALHNWFPPNEWESAQGMIWMSGRLMGGLTPLIWAILVSGTPFTSPLVTWRGAFVLFGALGLVWCLLFAWRFRNRPPEPELSGDDESAPAAHDLAERSRLGAIPWRALLTNRSLLALCAMYSLLNYGWAFNITYLPSYLLQRFELPPQDMLGAIYKGAPLWFGALGCLCGGYCVSRLDDWMRNRRRARRALGASAMLVCAACWILAREAGNLHLFCVSVSLAAFCVDLTLGAAWASCQDIGRAHAAVVAAIMNTVGTVGAAAAGWLTGTLVERAQQAEAATRQLEVAQLGSDALVAASMTGYQTVFATYAAMYLAAAACWHFGIKVDRTRAY